jgi:hypothetical protein
VACRGFFVGMRVSKFGSVFGRQTGIRAGLAHLGDDMSPQQALPACISIGSKTWQQPYGVSVGESWCICFIGVGHLQQAFSHPGLCRTVGAARHRKLDNCRHDIALALPTWKCRVVTICHVAAGCIWLRR